MTTLFAEKFLVPFIPVATVAGIGGSCLYIYSDEVFGPGSGYDIFIVAESTSVSNSASEDLYKEIEVVDSSSAPVGTIPLFSLPIFSDGAAGSAGTGGTPGASPNPTSPAPVTEPENTTPPVKKQRNYQCDLSTEAEKPVNKSCYITKKFEGHDKGNPSKNWMNLSHIGIPEDYDYLNQSFDNPIIEVPSNVTKDDLKATGNYFVIQVTESLFNQIKWEEEQTLNISVLGNETEYFAKLKPLFAVYADYVGIATEYVLTKIEKIESIETKEGEAEKTKITFSSSGSPSTVECKLKSFSDTSDNPEYPCEFFKFSTNTHTGDKYWYKTETFNSSFEKATDLEKDKYYLVKFQQKFFARRISNMEINSSITPTTPSSDPVLVTMGPAYPVVVVGSTGSQKLFILTKN